MNALAPLEVELEGVRLHALDEERCVAHVLEAVAEERGGWIVTPNLDHLRRLVADDALRARYGRADLAVADGMPLVWACWLQGTPLPGRVAGSDLITSLSRAAAAHGLSVFFLGGEPGSAEEAARDLAGRFAGLRVAGSACPALGFEQQPGALRELAAQLRVASPDVVFVALGSPKQELLIEDLRANLPAAWWIGVGISFSFVAGRVPRAPPWLRRIGGEWLHRLAQEPRRLARRYLVDGVPFGAGLITRSALRGLRSRVRWGRGAPSTVLPGPSSAPTQLRELPVARTASTLAERTLTDGRVRPAGRTALEDTLENSRENARENTLENALRSALRNTLGNAFDNTVGTKESR